MFYLLLISSRLLAQKLPEMNKITAANAVQVLSASQANLSFEEGLKNWTATGNAFANQPVEGTGIMSERVLTRMNYSSGGIGGDYWKSIPFAIGVKGNKWIGTYELGNGDQPTGTLTSKGFSASQRFVSFLLGGGKDLNLYVELQVKKSDYEAAWGRARPTLYGETEDGFTRVTRVNAAINSEELFRYFFDLDELLNHQFASKTIRIHIVDNKNSSWGHINFDDLQQVASLDVFTKINRDGFTLFMDKDKPLWGFADTHTHPMNYLGFGGGFIYGSMFGPLDRVMADCTPVHGGFATAGSAVVEGMAHSTTGHPLYIGFPRYNSKIHQQMHIDWIRRAYDGGLRMISMLAVNNWFTSTRFMKKVVDVGLPTNNLNASFSISNLIRDGFIPKDDQSSADLQILAFRAEIESNPQKYNWLEIARSPEDARRIVAENKLAIILGVELDMLGNFLPPNAPWGRGDVPNKVNYLSTDLTEARRQISRELDRLWALGVRQITPFHYCETWGGTPLFQRMFNNVNREMTGALYQVENGTPYGIVYNLDKDNGTDGLDRFFTSGEFGNSHRDPSWDQNPNGQINALGLSPYGKILLDEMMKRGFLIDTDHTSLKSFNEMVEKAESVHSPSENGYPVISSHTDPQEIALSQFSERALNDPTQWASWSTRTGSIKHEAQASAAKYEAIRRNGGTVAPLMSLYRKQTYRDRSGKVQVENNCDGSSRTWAQMYLYTLDKMGNKNVALSTDRGFIDFIGPRFSVNGAAALGEEKVDELKKTYRRQQVKAQTNGVKYDVPIRTYEHFRFDEWDNHYSGNENNIWRALATATVAKSEHRDYRTLNFQNSTWLGISGVNYEVMELTDGILKAWKNESFNLDGKGITIWGEWRAAAYAAVRYVDQHENFGEEQLLRFHLDRAKFDPLFSSFTEIYTSWKAMSGNNEPLRRHIVGQRDFDINLDGVAHYGMLPDFLQDLKNIGVRPNQLGVLFQSASDFIQTWEKAERMKAYVR
jgi:microsomal dipeptidase-like Zn-dependent dipeptidase